MHQGASYTLDDSVLALLKNSDDLIAAIAQDASTHEVLMLAWMNRDSLAQTIATGQATYWSRSRNDLWVKGATSGHTQKVLSISLDCDGDAIVLKVEQVGAACHTGSRTCFHQPIAVTA